MTMTTTLNGWACSDCLQLLANGETSPEMDEDETTAYLATMSDDERVTLGRVLGEAGCECTDWDSDQHRDGCERREFSWSRCDVCHRPDNAGERFAVTFWAEEDQ